MYRQEHVFIGGEHVRPASEARIEVVSPTSEEVIGSTPAGSPADFDRAVGAARRAFDAGPWPRMSPAERREVLLAAGKLLEPLTQDLTELVTAENGVPVRSRSGATASSFEYFANLPVPADEHRRGSGNSSALVVHEPRGVVACIVPWNAPVLLGLGKILPALLAGNTLVVKPSPETPLHDYLIAQAFADAGLPAGVLNVVPADREASEHLVRHPDVDMVSFTGSTAAGRRIGSICGNDLKHMVLELGGKSAAIVLPDADLSLAAPLLTYTGMLLNNGEACSAWARILAPRSRYPEVVDAIANVLQGVVQGDPMDPATEVGPLVAGRQRDRVEHYIKMGADEGARLVVGGGRPSGLSKGYFVEPTLFADVDNSMTIAQEEIFGPVGLVIPYDDVADAIRIANDSSFGLAGAVFTSDPVQGVEVARQIRSGTVAVNCLGMGHAYPFGGYKDSGLGRSHGPEGLAEFFEVKTIGLPDEPA
jgi:aldehyde dehydrogenase (NAD+)